MNQRKLLNSLNPLFIVGFTLVLILMRTSWDPVFPNGMREVDLLLPIVVYLGQRRSLPEGLILTLFCSHLYSLSSAAPIGVFATHYLLLFILSRLLSYVAFVTRWYSVMVMMIGICFLSRVFLTIIAAAWGHNISLFHYFSSILWALVVNSFLGVIVYYCLTLLDRMTYKAPRMSIELED